MSQSNFERLCLHLGRGTLLLVAVLLPLLLAEGVARLIHTPAPVRRVFDPFAYRIPRPLLVDTFRGRDGEPVTVRLNELGMRGPSISEPRLPGELRLVFLGGSTTENYAYPRQETFPELVGRELSERLERPVRVFNAGMSAATTATSLGRLQHQVLDLEPSLVVVMHGINDLLGGFHPSFRRDGRHLPRPALATDRPRSYLLDWLRSRRPRGAARPSGESTSVESFANFPALGVFERNLRSMGAVAEAHGVPILLLTQATLYREEPLPSDAERMLMADRVLSGKAAVPDLPSLARGMEAFNDAVRRLDGASGALTFDLARRLPKSEELIFDECHLTRAGNRRVAAGLVPVIESILTPAASPPSAAARSNSPEAPPPRESALSPG